MKRKEKAVGGGGGGGNDSLGDNGDFGESGDGAGVHPDNLAVSVPGTAERMDGSELDCYYLLILRGLKLIGHNMQLVDA